jgi:TolB-like protein/DNA-binding winged helix-turn-helix (wHTH) protein
MPTSANERTAVRFGVFEINFQSGELRKNGSKIKLQELPFQLLTLLLEHPGELVTREQLRRKLWPDGIYVDFERSLNRAVVKLRDALGDSAESPRFIETLPRRGYRLIAPVSDTVAAPAAPPSEVLNQRKLTMRRWNTGLIAVLLLVSVVTTIRLIKSSRSQQHRSINSIAVLPLDNLSADPAQDYFADGMTDELITELAQLGKLRVISRTSVLRYKNTRLTLPEIAHELNVDAVVEGSVLRSGDRVRISAQLVDARADRHMWAHSYESELRDVLTLQREVAHQIAQQIRLSVSGEQNHEAPARPLVPEAHDAYLQGRYHANKQTQKEMESALQYYRAALAKDPDYAPAYAAMGECYDYLALYYWKPRDALPQAKAAALKAVELDDSLAEGHAVLGIVYLEFDWNWPAAEREMRRALELNPSSIAHLYYAEYLASLGRRDEAVTEIERARSVDPFSLRVMSEGVFWEFIAHNYDFAIQAGRAALASEPNDAPLYSYLALIYALQKRYPEAIDLAEKGRRMDESAFIAAMVASTYAAAGRRADAERILNGISQEIKEQYSCSYEVSAAYVALGEVNQAFHWLDKAYDDRSTCMVALKQDPRFDGLHSDPRFQNLLRRVGFPEN